MTPVLATLQPDTLLDGPPDAPDTRVLFGGSQAMRRVLRAVRALADRDVPVVIHGEGGTGKELVARAIHHHGCRAPRPMVPFSPGALPPSAVDDVLFGDTQRPHAAGRLQAADGGTLFIDELCELPLPAQLRLRQALDRGDYLTPGSPDPVRFDTRVIASTSRDVEVEMRAGRLREDLLLRLEVGAVHLPPLRDRREDIPHLIRWLLGRICRDTGAPAVGIDGEALGWLVARPWPGNVRELEHVLIRASRAATGPNILLRDLSGTRRLAMPDGSASAPPSGAASPPGEGAAPHGESFEDLVMNRLRPVVRRYAPGGETSDLYELVVGTTEKALFTLALERTRGNQIRAAELLGISRNTLHKRLTDLKVDAALMRRSGRTRGRT